MMTFLVLMTLAGALMGWLAHDTFYLTVAIAVATSEVKRALLGRS